jgi:hypothetical protein
MCFLPQMTRDCSAVVPEDCECDVVIASLEEKYFDRWQQFRSRLTIRSVPIVQSLPKTVRNQILSKAIEKYYSYGDYIVRQGIAIVGGLPLVLQNQKRATAHFDICSQSQMKYNGYIRICMI